MFVNTAVLVAYVWLSAVESWSTYVAVRFGASPMMYVGLVVSWIIGIGVIFTGSEVDMSRKAVVQLKDIMKRTDFRSAESAKQHRKECNRINARLSGKVWSAHCGFLVAVFLYAVSVYLVCTPNTLALGLYGYVESWTAPVLCALVVALAWYVRDPVPMVVPRLELDDDDEEEDPVADLAKPVLPALSVVAGAVDSLPDMLPTGDSERENAVEIPPGSMSDVASNDSLIDDSYRVGTLVGVGSSVGDGSLSHAGHRTDAKRDWDDATDFSGSSIPMVSSALCDASASAGMVWSDGHSSSRPYAATAPRPHTTHSHSHATRPSASTTGWPTLYE